MLSERLLPSGQVTFLPRTSCAGDGLLVSLDSNARTEVRVRRRVVDARYLEGSIPATSKPPCDVAEGPRCVTPGELPTAAPPREGYVVIGAGKTPMDTCQFLLAE